MPRKTIQRKKKNYKRKRTGYKNSVRMGASPVPPKVYTSLICSTSGILSDGASFTTSKLWRPTSYYDLDVAIGGPTFSGYTFYSSMYNRYRVLSFSYELTLHNRATTSTLVGVIPDAASVAPAYGSGVDYTEKALENSYGKYHLLAPIYEGSVKKIYGYVDCQKVWGTPEVKTDNAWCAVIGNNPIGNVYLALGIKSIDGSALTDGIDYVLKVKSYGYWDERAEPTN